MKQLKRYLHNNPTALLAMLFGLWCVLNILTAANTELSSDETYYWFISQKLDWGYFDHPPLFALFAHVGTALLGVSDLAVRLLTTIAMPLALFLFWFIVKTDKPSAKVAVIYFMAAFSVPILHLYGFVLTPDAPLVLASVITLVAFKLLCDRRLLGILLLAIGFALLCYAKYHGALLVVLIIASRPKILVDWRFYLSCLIALTLVIPHFYWQYNHDWVSFRYHLIDRQSVFAWKYVWEYLGNFLGTFNPLLVVPFVVLTLRKNRMPNVDPMRRTLKFIFWGFFLFFLFSTSKGHVQPQWIILVVLPMLYFISRATIRSPRFARYVTRTSIVMGSLLFAVHVFAMINTRDLLRNTDIFNNRAKIQTNQSQFDSVDMIITSGSYQNASKLNYYGNIPSYAMPNIYSRSSQYEFIDMDTPLYGHRVAMEIGTKEYKEPIDTLLARHRSVEMPQGGRLFFDVIESYVPTRKVLVTFETFPAKVLTGSRVALLLHLYNPYDFDINIGGKDGFGILLSFIRAGEVIDIPLQFKPQVLGAKGNVNITTTVVIPVVETGTFRVGCTLQRSPYNSWYNSKVYQLVIINPKTRV